MKKYILALCLLAKMNATFRTFEITDKTWQNSVLEIKQPDGSEFKIPNAQILVPGVGFKPYNKRVEYTLEPGREHTTISWDRQYTFESQKTSCFCVLSEILRNTLTSPNKPKTFVYKIIKENSDIQITQQVEGEGVANFITNISASIVSKQWTAGNSLLGLHDFDYFDKSIIPLIELIARDLWVQVEIKRNREDGNGGDINFSFHPQHNLLTLHFD